MKLGLLAIGGALANFLSAKRNYEAAVKEAEQQNLPYLAAISQYDNSKYDELDKYDRSLYDNNAGLDVIIPTPILNCGMMAGVAGLAGDMCRCLLELVFQNVGYKTIYINGGLATDFMLFGKTMAGDISVSVPAISLAPGQRQTVKFSIPLTDPELKPKAVTFGLGDVYAMTDEMKKLRELILQAADKKYLTSILPATLPVVIANKLTAGYNDLGYVETKSEPILTANVSFTYYDEDNKDVRRALIRGCKGSCAYWGEAYYPNGKAKVWVE